TDAFSARNLQKAGYASNPLEDGSLEGWQVHAVPLTTLTVGALKEVEGVTPREAERAKNMFALGLMSWLYGRPVDATESFISSKFAKRPEIAEPISRRCARGTRSARRPRRSRSPTR